jgi:hypothetical protein
LPHSALSWSLSSAENPASLSLKDRATMWHYSQANPPHPVNQIERNISQQPLVRSYSNL